MLESALKKSLTALALAAVAVGAQAQVTFIDGTERPVFAAYNPNGTAGTLGPVVGGREDSTINTTAGILTATFLGFEAIDTDNFTFTLSSGTLSNKGALNASISGPVAAGLLNFSFSDLFQGTTVRNGENLGDFTSYAVLGSFAGTVFTPFTLGGAYDLILGFNDGLRVDADYDDMVVGLKVAAIPEPETYALFLAGLGALGFMQRRRRVD
jgi:PEP-CTERM motif-containing protein